MANSPNSFKRWNPLLGEWTIFAPVTDSRPWNGATLDGLKFDLPTYDPTCYLCPGVKRAGGETNPQYPGVHVFNNDFPSLTMNSSPNPEKFHETDTPVSGICRVVCFSPQHNITLAELSADQMVGVVKAFQSEYKTLSALPEIQNVMMFENKGKIIGVSNPHPHGQIYSTDFIPKNNTIMYHNMKEHLHKTGHCLVCEIMENELKDGARIVCQNQHFVAYIPYYARFKYEMNIVPKRHVSTILELTEDELNSLAKIYNEVVIRYDNLFEVPFPNITIFYNAPCKKDLNIEPWHFHIGFYPPMRSADKLKYLAGFETGSGNIINPSLPQKSAAELRNVATLHYSKK